MVTANFRFYGLLSTFLAPAHRDRAFACVCARQATAKHMIEALGAPHTEVGQILINDEPATLSTLLREGDRVEVRPALPTASAVAPRFVADAHLGVLARMLRMAGFDTLYDNGFDDATIEALAVAEQRLVLTRDRDLLKRSRIERGCYVHAKKPAQQLAEIAFRLQLAVHARPFTLCLHCNARLTGVGPDEVADQLPPLIRDGQYALSRCPVCARVYWKGSHWRRMRGLLEDASLHEEKATLQKK
jgi:uncharacterized protein with PIN domain